jgi:opacity protein-like surface antigen
MHAMKLHLRSLLPLALLGFAVPVFAQGYAYPAERPVQWFINGGASITEGDTANYLNNGWTIGTGFSVRPAPGPFLLRPEIDYSRFRATDQLIALGQAVNGPEVDDGNGQTITGFVNGVLEAPFNPWTRFYVTGGVGIGYRRIELTQSGFLCDPFFCSSGFGRNSLVASSDSTHFAWNAGVGMNFMLPAGQSWFIEARYERIETQAPTEFLPIRFGFRF